MGQVSPVGSSLGDSGSGAPIGISVGIFVGPVWVGPPVGESVIGEAVGKMKFLASHWYLRGVAFGGKSYNRAIKLM